MAQQSMFYKLQASGNDFILMDFRMNKQSTAYYSGFAKQYCDRKFGIGADGLLVIEYCDTYDFRMRIFNSDGTEADMCGNGARCAALWANNHLFSARQETRIMNFETKAGVIKAIVKGQDSETIVKLKMSQPYGLKFNIGLKIAGKEYKAHYINTGVPHAIIIVDKVNSLDVKDLGAKIRYHKKFKPRGTNVDFVEIKDKNKIKIRTYERGVEDETLACGTGTVASAIIADFYENHFKLDGKREMLVEVKSSEILKVVFSVDGKSFEDVWLEGKSYLVYYGYL